jgi:hypothetical protein
MAAPRAGDEDWIELLNPEAREVDVGGWWLTDDLDDPRKVRLPAGFRIGPGAHRLVPARLFDFSGAGGFGLSAQGDGIWLLSADSQGTLTGWVHGFGFGATPSQLTVGRTTSSDGTEHFVTQVRSTPGAANASPAPGPLIVSELAVRPSPAGAALGVRDSFVEIRNVSGAFVPLADPASLETPWRVRGNVEFDFDSGLTLAPGDRLILVGFDPALDSFELEGFRARYAIDVAVPVLGPMMFSEPPRRRPGWRRDSLPAPRLSDAIRRAWATIAPTGRLRYRPPAKPTRISMGCRTAGRSPTA